MANWELKENSTGDLTVVIEGEAWQTAQEKAFAKLAKNVKIDGFREGKAPKSLIEKRISKQEVQAQAVDDNANDWYRAALDECNVEPIDRAALNIKEIDDNHVELVFTFPVMPKATVKDYVGLPYLVDKVRVLKKDIDEEIERQRNNFAEMEVVDRKSKKGDTVNINFEGFKDGVAFEGGKGENYDLGLGSGSFIPGFEDQLIGKKADEEVDVELSFPEDYGVEDLAGQPVTFKVKVNQVKEKVVPELNDEFAADLNYPEVETLDDLKEFFKKRLTEEKKNAAEAKASDALYEALLEKIDVNLPDALVEQETQAQINQFASQLQAYNLSLTAYLQQMKQSVEDLKESYKEQAIKTLKLRLGLEAIADAEGLTPNDEDVEKQYQEIADQYGMEVDKVKELIDPATLKNDVKNQKAFEFIKEKASKVEKKTTKKKETEEAE